MTRVSRIIIVFFLLLQAGLLSRAQSHLPLGGGKTLEIYLDGDWKVRPVTTGFSVVEGQSYTVKFCLYPQKSRQAFFSYLKDKIDISLKVLNDNDNEYTKAYQHLMAPDELADLKRELTRLSEILGDKDPKKKFDNYSTEQFKYFLGRDFLKEQLFDKFLEVTYSIDGKKYDPEYFMGDKTVETSPQQVTAANTEIRMNFKIADPQKRFWMSYYQKAYPEIANLLVKVKPEDFYAASTAIKQFRTDIDALNKELTGLKSTYICDESLMQRAVQLSRKLDDNLMMRMIRTNWLKYWPLLNEGTMRLNPLSFTDEKNLRLNLDYDKEKATLRDQYIESTIQLLIKSDQVNAQRTDQKAFDALLAERNKGMDVFGHKEDNDKLKSENQKNRDNLTKLVRSIDTLVIRVVPEKKQDKYFLKIWDAGDEKLKPGAENDYPALPNTTTVETMGYNLSAKQDLALKETSTTIADGNQAIAQLGQVNDVASIVAAQANSSTGIFQNIAQAINPVQPTTIPMFRLKNGAPSIGVSLSTSFAGVKTMKAGELYSVESNFSIPGKLTLQGKKNTARNTEVVDISSQIRKFLVSHDIDLCPALLSSIEASFRKKFPKISLTMNFEQLQQDTIAPPFDFIKIDTALTTIIQNELTKFEGHKVAAVKNDLSRYENILRVAEFLVSTKGETLPPASLAAGNDPGSYLFHNKFIAVADETTPKQKDLELTLSERNTTTATVVATASTSAVTAGATTTATATATAPGTATGNAPAATPTVLDTKHDLYKTSPGHWVTGSLGAGYIFHGFRRSDAIVTNGVLTNTPDEEQFRLFAGLHFYYFPIVLTDDRSIFQLKTAKELLSRVSLYTGVSFPKPFYNLQPGISVDIWAGIKITGGLHFYRYTDYKILSNQIIDQHSRYVYNGAFISLNIEPVTFAKILQIIK